MNHVDRYMLEHTLEGLERGLHVRHIATMELISANADEEISEIAIIMQQHDFSQLPVTDHGAIVGVLENDGSLSGRALDHMRPLTDSMLVAADAPLAQFVSVAADSPYRLVVDNAKVAGIVARSDLHKLPVRLYVFTLVSHLENEIAQAIHGAFPDSTDWLNILGSNSRNRIRKRWDDYKLASQNPDMLELTVLADKIEIAVTTFNSSDKDRAELCKIKDLRNQVAHGRSYVGTKEMLTDFVDTLRLVEHWMGRARQLSKETSGEGT